MALTFERIPSRIAPPVLLAAGETAPADDPAVKEAIAAWQDENGKCRGGSGDSDETWKACDRRDAIGAKLKAAGWCYGRPGEAGYQMAWHRCEEDGEAADAKAAGPAKASFNPADYPAKGSLTGQTRLPDFKGRDREFNSYRTRIREGMRAGPNYAGRYSVIQIGCGAGCSFVIVGDNKTGRPVNFPRGGEDNMYLQLLFELDSRLLTAQWGSYDSGKCYVEWFDFDGGSWTPLGKTEVGSMDACYKDLAENLR